MALSLFARVVDKTKLVFNRQITDAAAIELEGMSRSLARDFVRTARIYPPESEANRPPHPYWQRGTGRVFASGNVNPVSQNLGPSWEVSGFKTPFGGEARVTNPVTYAPFVHSDTLQAGFHARRGWKTVSQIGEELGISLVNNGTDNYNVSSAPNYLERTAGKITTFMQNIFK